MTKTNETAEHNVATPLPDATKIDIKGIVSQTIKADAAAANIFQVTHFDRRHSQMLNVVERHLLPEVAERYTSWQMADLDQTRQRDNCDNFGRLLDKHGRPIKNWHREYDFCVFEGNPYKVPSDFAQRFLLGWRICRPQECPEILPTSWDTSTGCVLSGNGEMMMIYRPSAIAEKVYDKSHEKTDERYKLIYKKGKAEQALIPGAREKTAAEKGGQFIQSYDLKVSQSPAPYDASPDVAFGAPAGSASS